MLLGFDCTINPQNLIKIVGVIFERNLIFLLFEQPLIVGLGDGDGRTDGRTDRHTHTRAHARKHFSKTLF